MGFHVVLILAAAWIAVVGGGPDDGVGPGGLDARLFADQLIDDLTTLEALDRAGDPFTDLDDVTPSLSVEAADPNRVNLPAFTERYGPGPERSGGRRPGRASPTDSSPARPWRSPPWAG